MSSFSFPDLPAADIIAFFADQGIAGISPDDLANPNCDFVCSLYTNILAFIEPYGFDPEGLVDFRSLDLLDNPDLMAESLRKTQLYHKMKGFIHGIKSGDFTFKDVLRPDPRRTTKFLSSIVNFLLYRVEKMNLLCPIVDRLPSIEERRAEVESKLSELNRESLENEAAREMEQPIVEALDAEVKELRRTIHTLNKEQMQLKSRARELKEEHEALHDKISQADFELVKNAQENSELLSKIVQSPDKLQRAIEEKKIIRAEALNAERSALLAFKERTAKLEVYSKALEKVSRHFEKIRSLQEQVNSNKAYDKDVKALKAKLRDDELTYRSLEAQIVEAHGKVKQAEDFVKATEKEKDVKLAEHTKKVDTIKSEMDTKLHAMEQRELKAGAMVTKGEQACAEADSVREAGKAKELEILKRSEQIADEYRMYSKLVIPILQRVAENECPAIEGGI